MGEDARQRFGKELGVKADRHAEGQGHRDARPEALFHPADEARAVVLGRHGRYGRGDGHRWQHGEDDDLLDDADGCRGHDAHLVGDDRDEQERHVDQRVLQSQRSAQREHLPRQAARRADVASREGDAQPLAAKEPQRRDETGGLCEHRGDGGAHGAQSQSADKGEVEHDVRHAGQRHEVERRARVAEAAQDAAHHVVAHDERDAQRADEQVVFRVAQGFGRCLHQAGKGRVAQRHDRCQHHGHQGEDPGGRPDGPGHLPLVAGARADGDEHRRPRRQACDDARGGLHHLAADGHAGHAGRVVELPYHEEVSPAVEGLQHVGHQER